MTPRSPETMAEGIAKQHGLVCLVPKPGSQHVITCHEKTLCDCEVIRMLTEALRTYGAEMRRQALTECADIAWKRAKDGIFTDIAAEQITKKIRALIAKEKT